MKLLYIGTYKEPSGWGEASRTDLLALSKQFDVVARPIVYSGGVNHPEIEKLESKSTDGVTQVFQYCLPTEYDMYGRMPHFGYCEIESSDLTYSKWPEHFNKIRALFVPNKTALDFESNNKITKRYLPHAINTERFNREYTVPPIKQASGDFKFLCVAEAIPRKNLEGLIEAYYTEFDPSEPVSLIIKTNRNIDNIIRGVQNKVKLYRNEVFYKKVIVISDRIKESDMMGLYQMSDCVINTSMGESWCLPIVNGVGFNKWVITSNLGGPADICEKYPYTKYLTANREQCHHGNNIENFQNSNDYWYKPTTKSIREEMRSVVNDKTVKVKSNVLEEFTEEKFCGRSQELLNESK
jgi:glycosyltransferase involved in cell wall biosynthesis